MVDIDAAVGFVVARGDWIDRARLSWLRAGIQPGDDVLEQVEAGQLRGGGWPAQEGDSVGSIDATCYRLGELDDLGGLGRPATTRALDWLANRQRRDGFWEEDAALADSAPDWARPGDPDARFYLTSAAGYWLAVAARDHGGVHPLVEPTPSTPVMGLATPQLGTGADTLYPVPLSRAAEAIRGSLQADGAWPGFLASGWHAAGVLHLAGYYYEAARIFILLGERVTSMSASDAAAMAAALRRIGVSEDDPALVAARARLEETQRPDGSWPSDLDGAGFDVHTTLNGIRATR
jgi:hypothetical protein